MKYLKSFKILFTERKLIRYYYFINPKEAGEGGGSDQFDTPSDFSKNMFFREMVKPWFLVTYNIIISHIFLENCNVIPQVIQKL